MKRVWKFEIPICDKVLTLSLPKDSTILSFQCQQETMVDSEEGQCFIWALVDPNNDTEPRYFVTYGTGQVIRESNTAYIGTTQQSAFVWHLFELKES